MVRTPMAEALLEPLQRLLAGIGQLSSVGRFDPATA